MNCPRCGALLEKESKFCTSCGAVLERKKEDKSSDVNMRSVLENIAVITVLFFIFASIVFLYESNRELRQSLDKINKLDAAVDMIQEPYWEPLDGIWEGVKITSMNKEEPFLSISAGFIGDGKWNYETGGAFSPFGDANIDDTKIVIGDDVYEYKLDGETLTITYKSRDNVFKRVSK